MLKRRLSLVIVIAMILSMFVPTAYAVEANANSHPLSAIKAMDDMRANSYSNLFTNVDVTSESAIYAHLTHLSTEPRKSGTDKEIHAKDYIANVFENTIGYATTAQAFSYTSKGNTYNSNNVIATKQGNSNKQIIVGAHYDSVTAGKGADDNASGVAVMLGVAEMLKGVTTDYTVKFVAFGAEEVGDKGSTYYASQMTQEEKDNTIAMINLDSIIAGDKMFVYGDLGQKGWVRDQALDIAKSLNLKLETQQGLNPEYPAGTTGDWSDHAPFQKLGIPIAYFESTNWEIGDLDGYVQTAEHGTIFHSEKDSLEFLNEKFPGRVQERLLTFTTVLYNLLVEAVPSPITTSTNLISMSQAKEVEVAVNLGYTPNLNNLEWTFGGIPFAQWKTFVKSETGKWGYTGDPFISFEVAPHIEGNTVKATIKFDLPYKTTNLQGRPYPRRVYPELIGDYNLAVADKSTNALLKTPMKLNPYDSYHTYDEILPAVEEIIKTAKTDRYIKYEPMGKSTEGRDIPFVMFARDKAEIDKYLNETLPMMLESPAALIEKINAGTASAYKPAIWFNNIHSDEANGVDAQIDILEKLSKEDTITFDTLDQDNKTIIHATLNVQDLLDNYIILFNLNNNPDGRYYNEREIRTGFDPNRDVTYQTQVETANVFQGLAKWSPMIMNDFHGFVKQFLIEPCTPPHDPNFEFDLLMDGMINHAHAIGNAGISNTKYDSYIIPYYDYGEGWDDGAPMYAAVLGMMHGAMGHTIEIPELNQESNNAFMYAGFGSLRYALENKDKLFKNQLEIYRRGVEGIDSREVDKWLINAKKEVIGRPRKGNDNFFPEYYVLPVDKSLQKNPLAAYEMAQYLIKNGVKVEKTIAPVTVGDVSYPAGSYIVPMHQAKRGFANTVLYDGSDFSDWGAMYAEVTMSFPDLRGFNKYEVRVKGAFNEKTQKVKEAKEVTIPQTVIPEAEQIIIKNTNNDATKAINELLANGKSVRMTYSAGKDYNKGDFVVLKKDLDVIKSKYFLELTTYTGNADLKTMKQPKVAAVGEELIFVLKQLGFNLTDSFENADVIVDSYGYISKSTITSLVQGGKPYIGIGGNPIYYIEKSGLLPGFKIGSTDGDHEGVVRAVINTDNVITGGYSKNDVLYNNSGTWIETVPTSSAILATLSDKDDFYVAGWWPGHDKAKGKTYILQDKIGNGKITLFANHITNKAHPSHQFRMLANAIYDGIAVTETSGNGGSGSNINSVVQNNTIQAGKSGTITENGLIINVPANAFDKDFKVTVNKLLKTSNLSFSNNEKLLSDVFEITKDKTGNFSKRITISLKFDKNLVDTDKYTISLYWLDETNNKWVELDDVIVDKESSLVKGNVNHFTKFAVIAKEKSINMPTDIANHWAEANIKELIKLGAITGYPDNTIKPNNNITRAEFATILVKSLKLEAKAGAIFSDAENHWAKNYISVAADNGIILGYGNNMFGPNDLITREQMAVMIAKAIKLESTTDGTTFLDKDQISSWAKDYVAAAVKAKKITGYPEGIFKPKENATRAEAITVIFNCLNKIGN